METTYTIFDHDGDLSSARMTELLRFLSPWCDELVLVVRDETILEPPGLELLDAMAPSLRSVTRSKVWPGTQSIPTATIHSFDLNDFVLSNLNRTGNGLFDWQHPDWPEDPCLLSVGDPVLASIADDPACLLQLSSEQEERLKSLGRFWREVLDRARIVESGLTSRRKF